MTKEDQYRYAQETWERTQALLPEPWRDAMRKHPDDPSILPKGQNNIVRVRILPERRYALPRGFWRSTACYYEIVLHPGTGVDSDTDSSSGKVQFFQYGRQKQTGQGRYLHGVAAVLAGLERLRRPGFQSSFTPEGSKFHFAKRYPVRRRGEPAFSVEEAARDMAWLITQSMPAFTALSEGQQAGI